MYPAESLALVVHTLRQNISVMTFLMKCGTQDRLYSRKNVHLVVNKLFAL